MDLEANLNATRLKTIAGHLKYTSGDQLYRITTESIIPKRRQELLKSDGWGYNDSGFKFDASGDRCTFEGSRYDIGNKSLPYFLDWVVNIFGINPKDETIKSTINLSDLPKAIINQEFVDDLINLTKQTQITISEDASDRLFRSHGQCLHEIFAVRLNKIRRLPDLIVWPKCHQDVVEIINLALKNNVVVIPFGGGTSVSGALECPEEEKRMIISLDTSQMNAIHWIDHQNFTAKVEAGIIGQDLERELSKYNLCSGHEPDSFEFSSLGGWIATRASGMKKNIYGNIEDIVVHVKMVTTNGTVQRSCTVPRVSIGPDVQHFIFGSEGTLGVVTEAVIKVKPLPECKRYGSLVFPDFETGFKFMREVGKQRLKPASVRLMDNEQFMFGQAIKPEESTFWNNLRRSLQKVYLLKLKGFDPKKISVATLLFEGTKEEVDFLENKIIQLGTSLGAISGGEENGRRGYVLTFVIAYLRDLALEHGIVAESFETSVPWDRCLDLCRNVVQRIELEMRKHGIQKPPFISHRITQTYDSGACVYFYFAFYYRNMIGKLDPVEVLDRIESAARDEILANGGSLSHHHGVGKIRKKWLRESVSDTGLELMRAVKSKADPKNIFANGNLMT